MEGVELQAAARHQRAADPVVRHARPPVDEHGPHAEGAQEAEHRPFLVRDQQAVLDPAHPVDEGDPARGREWLIPGATSLPAR